MSVWRLGEGWRSRPDAARVELPPHSDPTDGALEQEGAAIFPGVERDVANILVKIWLAQQYGTFATIPYYINFNEFFSVPMPLPNTPVSDVTLPRTPAVDAPPRATRNHGHNRTIITLAAKRCGC